ncbi:MULTISPECIES: hypothetical protein [Limnobacter]|nr:MULTISPECIES: hypothetical protein [Limnobacter]
MSQSAGDLGPIVSGRLAMGIQFTGTEALARLLLTQQGYAG